MISSDLLDRIRSEFVLPLAGIHGEAHWARVCENGLRLAEQTGADPQVVVSFAYLHDVKRQDDGWDRAHGQRAAAFVRNLPTSLLALPDDKLESLVYAIAHHSDGSTAADVPRGEVVTVQTCWDADRLDLGRISIRPNPKYLCTEAAKDPATIAWAFQRSQSGPVMRWQA
jgi:uncharacterized protein